MSWTQVQVWEWGYGHTRGEYPLVCVILRTDLNCPLPPNTHTHHNPSTTMQTQITALWHYNMALWHCNEVMFPNMVYAHGNSRRFSVLVHSAVDRLEELAGGCPRMADFDSILTALL